MGRAAGDAEDLLVRGLVTLATWAASVLERGEGTLSTADLVGIYTDLSEAGWTAPRYADVLAVLNQSALELLAIQDSFYAAEWHRHAANARAAHEAKRALERWTVKASCAFVCSLAHEPSARRDAAHSALAQQAHAAAERVLAALGAAPAVVASPRSTLRGLRY
jgi:hypothetical protein